MRVASLVLVGLLLGGCGDSESTKDTAVSGDTATEPSTQDTDGTDDTDSGDTHTGTDTDTDTSWEVTYHRDVRPIVETHCTRCHSDIGAGAGNFTNYDEVSSALPAMLAAIEDGRMPPPAADPDCREYKGSDQMVLDDDERAVLQTWSDLGTPEGLEDTYIPPDALPTELESPDVEVMIPQPYTPAYTDTNNPGNEYRCFTLDIGHTDDIYITGLAPIIDAGSILHHAVLFKKSRSFAEKLGPDGYDCWYETGAVTDMVHAWAPGAMPLETPEGMGIRLAGDEMLVVQWHYYAGDNEGLSDQSGYALNTTPMVDQELSVYPYGPYDMHIPAGEEAHVESLSYPLPVSGSIYSIFPHMHVLGSGYEFSVDTTEEGEICGVQADRYDFDNQLTYVYEEPLYFDAWSWLTMECTFNNSTSNPDLIHNPPIDVYWGERTDEEMCFAFLLVDFSLF